MKVLFIDDEPLIRKGLQAVISWKDFGFDTFLEAEDGTEGLEIIQKENPELIMLDIQMEKMSGLSLAQTARDNDYNGRIIILSGYSDFAYAKTAISCGVTAYLLKPVDPVALTEAVEKALDELQKERLVSIYSEQSVSLSQNSILTQILTGSLGYTKSMDEVYHLDLAGDYFKLFTLYYSNASKAPAQAQKITTSLGKKYMCANVETKVQVLIANSLAQEQYIKKQLPNLLTDLSTQDSPIVVLSDAVKNVKDLPALYSQCQSLYADYYFYKLRDNDFISQRLIDSHFMCDNFEQFNLISFTEGLIKNILLLDDSSVEKDLLQLHSYFVVRKPPKDSLGFMLVNCYMQILGSLAGSYPKIELELPDKDSFTSKLYTFKYLCDCMDYFQKQLAKMIFFIKEETQASPCSRICQYVEANYASPLKLETIAAMFGYNSAYLGKLFTKEMGQKFVTYLDEVRIKHAKEYLEKGATVAQACENAGFANTDYFTKKFKKYVGCLPSEYRKQHTD